MATQGKQVYADIESLRETWTLAEETESSVAVMDGDRPGVTYSGTPGLTRTVTVGPFTISGIPVPTNGQGDKRATVSTTGTWEFPVVGGDSATAQSTKVYFVVADGTLTLTKVDDATTPFFGVVNLPEGYVQSGTSLPVKIGVVA